MILWSLQVQSCKRMAPKNWPLKLALIFALCCMMAYCKPAKSITKRGASEVEQRERNQMKEHNCSAIEGATQPVDIYNSDYWLLPDNSFCCPLYPYHCIPEEDVEAYCADEGKKITDEPCFHCKTCAKRLGEICGGVHKINGTCEEELECFGGENGSTGVCMQKGGPPSRDAGEMCGGLLNSLGVCNEDSVCTEVERRDHNVCVMEGEGRL